MTELRRSARAILVPSCDRPAEPNAIRTLAAAMQIAGRRGVSVAAGSGPELASGCAGQVLYRLVDYVRRDANGAVLVVPVGDARRDVELAHLVTAAREEPDRIHVPAGAEEGEVVAFAGSVTSLLLAFHQAHPELLKRELSRRSRRRSPGSIAPGLCIHRDVLARVHPGLVQRLPPSPLRRLA